MDRARCFDGHKCEIADRFYLLLAYFDERGGTYLDHMVRAAREGYERDHMEEPGAWDEFDSLWARRADA